MENYANNLKYALDESCRTIDISEVRPTLGLIKFIPINIFNLQMRLARYLHYPLVALSNKKNKIFLDWLKMR
jgi:hypothetical protein